MNRYLVLALLSISALQACDRSQSTESRPEETSAAAAPASSASASPPTATKTPAATAASEPAQEVRYQCENGMVVLADYESGREDRVRLVINDKKYSLSLTPSASGARYQTDDGLTPGKSLVWWSKSPEALLIEEPIEQKQDAESSLTCQEVANK